jgi:phytoene desaturase
MRVVVIGAGLGGLSAAAHLARSDHDVTVVERSAGPGGRAAVSSEAGFRLDLGPTVFAMPNLLAETFEAVGASMSDFVEIEPVDPMYRAAFSDGSALLVRSGREAMTEEIRNFAGRREAGVFNEFCDRVSELYELALPNSIDTNFDSVFGALRPWRSTLELIRTGGFRRLDRMVASFFDDERLRDVFSFRSMYAGVAPQRALALHSMVTYMETVSEVFAPRGGMQAAAAGLERAVGLRGATFRYGANVTRILRNGDGAASGVELDTGDRFVADAVVCNADLPIAYRTLLGGVDAPRVARRGTYSPSCVLWVAGVRGAAPADAAVHNVHFGPAWRDSFDAVTRRGRLMRDPSMFVSIGSSVAPVGCTTLYALEPVPNLDGKTDWVRDGERVAERLRSRVGAAGYPIDDVVVERVIDPLSWERMGLERGTPFSLANTWRQAGPLRPNNRDERIPGLFFAGSSTLPGVGVPMVLLSGKLAARRVHEYERSTSTVRW